MPQPGEAEPRPGELSPADLGAVLERLARSAPGLRGLATADLLEAWDDAVAALLDPRSDESRRLLTPAFAGAARLSPAGLAAALDAVLRGLRRPAADRLATHLAERKGPPAHRPRAVYLAANIPGLAAQPLLRALLERRPTLLKSSSAEPWFAPALVAALAARLPAIAAAAAAVCWRGGDPAFEQLLGEAGFEIELYGGAAAVRALAGRAPRLLVHGPKASLGVVTAGADLALAARGLADDIALFDQRGCLSVQAVYVLAPLERAKDFADRLAAELAASAERLPPGAASAEELAGVQQLCAEAEMRGLTLHAAALPAGTVVVDPRAVFVPTPGLRSVRVHPLADEAALLDVLRPWAGGLQGVALAGAIAASTSVALEALGVSRTATAGTLQRPDATWANWGERLGGER